MRGNLRRVILMIFIVIMNMGIIDCNITKEEVGFTDNEINEGLDVIKNSFKYENDRNEEELKKCYTEVYKDTNFMLTNINSAQIKEVALLKDKRNYYNYLKDGRGNIRNIDINNVKIFKVKYDKKYVDDSIMPMDSGIDEKGFILIRENSTYPWRIDGAGEPYFCEDEEILL
ncbi:MAG: DUF4829 domain-containing protein [Clostridium sp.]|uniref:DUF4829 domain-containing protein n=1 Tax=Clostridium sp. TaxID=1506 RepID=UPI002906430A|nr:DUF4829 domain-containing protein [Clostridium sp.]MDU4939813.1 DUF4829 domain-containing protein [Clostridium sp.]